jgi:hypothetical protein
MGRWRPGRRRGTPLRWTIGSGGHDRRSDHIGTGIAPAPSRRRPAGRRSRGIIRVPPRRSPIAATAARPGLRGRPDRQIGPAHRALCLLPGVPILRLECPPTGADDSDHGSLSGRQPAPRAQPSMEASSQSKLAPCMIPLIMTEVEGQIKKPAIGNGREGRTSPPASPRSTAREAGSRAVSAGSAYRVRAAGQFDGPTRRALSRGPAFRTQNAVADIPIKARTPLAGSGTAAAVTLALSA